MAEQPKPAASHPAAWRGRLFAACFLVTTLAACTTGFVYNRLDWIVAWYVGDFVTLDERQKDELHAIVHRTLDWHRGTQLPRYVALLETLAAEASKPISGAQLEEHYQEVQGFADDFLRHVAPDAASLLATLNDRQITELAENLEEDNEELWDELAGDTPAERVKRRRKSAVRSLQRMVGRLDKSQRALVESRLSGMHDVAGQWLERRRHWQSRFLDVLRSHPGEATLEPVLLDLFLDPDQFDPPDYRRRADENRRLVTALIAELSGQLADSQRDHLRRKFAEYADDLRDIARD
jgi:hypothetical protein